MSDVIKNEPEYLIPIQNWDDFHYFRNILAPKEPVRSEWDFVWVSVLYPDQSWWPWFAIRYELITNSVDALQSQ
jgi:hypothetical protein